MLVSGLLVTMMSLIFIGCMNNKVTDNSEVNLFRQKEAMEVAKRYLEAISVGDIQEANKLYSQEAFYKNKDIGLGKSKINSFVPKELIESGEWAYVIFNVIRSPITGVECDLDNLTIKVVKEGLEYKIAEVESANKQHIFEKNNALRMVGEDGSKSELIINMSNIPKDVYIKEGSVMLNKEAMKNNKFGPTALSYTGEKLAITTLGDNKVFICGAKIEKSKKTQGNVEGKSSNEAGKEENLEGLLDKPIAQKIIPIDILNDVKIKNIVFSELEQELIVEYIEKSGAERINIYKENDGQLLPLKLDEMFPKEKYNIKLKGLDKKVMFISVLGREGATDIHNELIGNYKIDLNKKQITKI